MMRAAPLMRPVVFQDLNYYATNIQQYTYCKLAWSKADCKRMQEYDMHLKQFWKDVDNWRVVTEEQIEAVKNGGTIDPSKLRFH